MPDFLRDLDDIISIRQRFKSDPPMHTKSEKSTGPVTCSGSYGACAEWRAARWAGVVLGRRDVSWWTARPEDDLCGVALRTPQEDSHTRISRCKFTWCSMDWPNAQAGRDQRATRSAITRNYINSLDIVSTPHAWHTAHVRTTRHGSPPPRARHPATWFPLSTRPSRRDDGKGCRASSSCLRPVEAQPPTRHPTGNGRLLHPLHGQTARMCGLWSVPCRSSAWENGLCVI